MIYLIGPGCDNGSNVEQVTGKVVADVGQDEPANPEPEIVVYNNGSSGSGSSGDDEPEYETFDSGPEYDSGNCNEYNCPSPSECYHGQCKTPECVTDADCEDDDPCTPTVCNYAGHVNAFCSGPITELKNNDGCCPQGAWVDKDTDCKPICGNQKCEYGETVAMCEIDCKDAGPGSPKAPPAPSYPQGEYT
ncbi:hypothetical protein KY363_04140 [Candidatus Woesearchaeota archaeon]|nr:hypothetical protein [Candidatus Woesearchaeota archaeon]